MYTVWWSQQDTTFLEVHQAPIENGRVITIHRYAPTRSQCFNIWLDLQTTSWHWERNVCVLDDHVKLVRAPSKPACNGKSIGSGSTRLGEYLVPVSKKLGGGGRTWGPLLLRLRYKGNTCDDDEFIVRRCTWTTMFFGALLFLRDHTWPSLLK